MIGPLGNDARPRWLIEATERAECPPSRYARFMSHLHSIAERPSLSPLVPPFAQGIIIGSRPREYVAFLANAGSRIASGTLLQKMSLSGIDIADMATHMTAKGASRDPT